MLVDLLNLTPALVHPDPNYGHVVQIRESARSFDLHCESWESQLVKGGLDLA